MAITYGFYNSMNGDRKYDAVQLSSIFDGVIRDGVFQSIGGYLATKPGTGMQVIVAPGKAWFDHTWTVNDADLPLDIAQSDLTLSRYDAVVLETDATKAVRENSIKVLKGTPSSDPQKPTLTNEGDVHQHPLAYILVPGGSTEIQAQNIDIMVGKTECPFVTSILESVSIEALLEKWEGEFRVWFDDLQDQMSGDVATNLQNQINELDERVTPLETLGGRVETNTYNIAMLALLHAKAGEFPPNTKKMIVHVSGDASNLRDYCGITPSTTEQRSTVGSVPLKNTVFGGTISGFSYVRYKGKYVWHDATDDQVIESSDMTGNKDKKVLIDEVRGRSDSVRFYMSNDILRIGVFTKTSTGSSGRAEVRLYEYDGDSVELKTSYANISNSNFAAFSQSIAIDSEKIVYMYNTSDSDHNGHGGILLDDGTHIAVNSIGETISASAISENGFYISTVYDRSYMTSDDYIRYVTNSAVAQVSMPENDRGLRAVVYKGVAFFIGTTGIYREVSKNTFEKIEFPDSDITNRDIYASQAIFFIHKNELYFMSSGDYGGKHSYRFLDGSFVEDDSLYAVFGYSAHPSGSLGTVDLYDSLGNPLGYTKGNILYEYSFSENGFYETLDYSVGEFQSADIYVGGKLASPTVHVSTDGGKSWVDSEIVENDGTEIRAHFVGLSGSSLSIRVEFDLGSGYIDYIVGGVY